MDPELEEMPTDTLRGLDFRVSHQDQPKVAMLTIQHFKVGT
jgi:hypothetical protein